MNIDILVQIRYTIPNIDMRKEEIELQDDSKICQGKADWIIPREEGKDKQESNDVLGSP